MKSVNILLVAMDVELESLKNSYDLVEVPVTRSNKSQVFHYEKNKNWLIVKSGVGQINTSIILTELSLKYQVQSIIQFGVGGGISQNVLSGDYVIATTIVQHDACYISEDRVELMGTGELFLSKEVDQIQSPSIESSKILQEKLVSFCNSHNLSFHIGSVASGSSFVSSKGEKQRIASLTGAVMVEMEAAAAAYFAGVNSIEYGFIKVCSDSLGNNTDTQYKSFIDDNVKNVVELLSFFDQ
jgi:adenosylhomocysteine nucleosidase